MQHAILLENSEREVASIYDELTDGLRRPLRGAGG